MKVHRGLGSDGMPFRTAITLWLILTISTISTALKCPCNVGPCPSISNDQSILDTCTRVDGTAFCERKVSLNLENGHTRNEHEIYGCTSVSHSDRHIETELSIHVPMDDTHPILIKYRCNNHDNCSIDELYDHHCDMMAVNLFGNPFPALVTTDELRSLIPPFQTVRPLAPWVNCTCVDNAWENKETAKLAQHCVWSNHIRLDSGHHIPVCKNDHVKEIHNRASVHCTGRGGNENGWKWKIGNNWKCMFTCNYQDECNKEEEFEKLYCAGIRQLRAMSKKQARMVIDNGVRKGENLAVRIEEGVKEGENVAVQMKPTSVKGVQVWLEQQTTPTPSQQGEMGSEATQMQEMMSGDDSTSTKSPGTTPGKREDIERKNEESRSSSGTRTVGLTGLWIGLVFLAGL